MNRLTTVMDSRHLTLEDLGNSLLTGWPIQKIFCSSTEEKHTQQKEVEPNCQCSKDFTQPTRFVEDETHSKYCFSNYDLWFCQR